MLLKGHKNSTRINETATRIGAGLACWRVRGLASFGLTPIGQVNSLMPRDNGQSARMTARMTARMPESFVGSYLFNQHR